MSVEDGPPHAPSSSVGWFWNPRPLTYQNSAPIHQCWVQAPDQPAATEMCFKVIQHKQPQAGSTYRELAILMQLQGTPGVLQMLGHFQGEDEAIYMLLE